MWCCSAAMRVSACRMCCALVSCSFVAVSLPQLISQKSMQKADSTLRTSQAVPHPSTIRALSRLTSEVRRDPVHSTRCGRQRMCVLFVVTTSELNLNSPRCNTGTHSSHHMTTDITTSSAQLDLSHICYPGPFNFGSAPHVLLFSCHVRASMQDMPCFGKLQFCGRQAFATG